MSARGLTPARPRALSELAAGLVRVPPEVMVSDITLDSRAATPGALFLGLRGRTHHGLEFAAEAVARGARAVLYEQGADAPAAPGLGADIFVARGARPRCARRPHRRPLLRCALAAPHRGRHHRHQRQDHLRLAAGPGARALRPPGGLPRHARLGRAARAHPGPAHDRGCGDACSASWRRCGRRVRCASGWRCPRTPSTRRASTACASTPPPSPT